MSWAILLNVLASIAVSGLTASSDSVSQSQIRKTSERGLDKQNEGTVILESWPVKVASSLILRRSMICKVTF